MLNRGRPISRFKAWRRKRRSSWEETCAQCGLCCFQKRYRNGRLVIDLSAPCVHLDTESRTCKVYENRFRVCPDCKKVTMYHALFSTLMPENCAYVRRYRKLKFLIPTPKIIHARGIGNDGDRRPPPIVPR